jgi:phosphate/sulfate permease
MLLPIAFALGMLVGWRRAAQRGGDRLDRLQYGAAHGIAFTLAALALSILAGRLGLV